MTQEEARTQDFGFSDWHSTLMDQTQKQTKTLTFAETCPDISSKRLGKRLNKLTAQAHDHSSHMFSGKGDLFLINQERKDDRQLQHKHSMDMIKNASVCRDIKAPGREKTMSIKARLRSIDAMVQVNASEMQSRGHVLAKAKSSSPKYSSSEPHLCPSAPESPIAESLMPGPLFATEAQLTHERCAKLPPVTGPMKAERMAKAVLQARKLLEKREDFDGADIAWAERKMEECAELQHELDSTPQRPSQQQSQSQLQQRSRELSMRETSSPGGFGGVMKSASAPSLGMLASPLGLSPPGPGAGPLGPARRRPRLQHDVLYPSMRARTRVIEEHASRNAAHIATPIHVRLG